MEGPAMYALLADLVVVVHFLLVLFVIGGAAAVLVGAPLGWRWVRNWIFRLVHLVTILVVAIDSTFGVLCPLTTWEYELRRRAGQTIEQEISFFARLVRAVLFYDLPPWAFTTAYVAFAALVLATLVMVPPRWPWSRPRRSP